METALFSLSCHNAGDSSWKDFNQIRGQIGLEYTDLE